jgi:hypothetical protein
MLYNINWICAFWSRPDSIDVVVVVARPTMENTFDVGTVTGWI